MSPKALLIRSWSQPRKLDREVSRESFTCGHAELDEWFTKYALINQDSGMVTVFISEINGEIAAFYALSAGQVSHANAPARVSKAVPNHPIPVVILSRFAVSTKYQRIGLGRAMLRDLLIRISNLAEDDIGVRALLIHAKDENARAFYMAQAEFEPSPTDSMHLYLLMKDLRRALRAP
jgi:GNAT superfamily N-acetyltransferase